MPREERRQHLLAAAREEFLTFGYQGARTRSIAERAGVTEALLYQHFDSKEDVFEEAVVAPLKRTVEELTSVGALPATDDDDTLQRAHTHFFVKQTLEAMTDSAALFGIVLFSNHQADGRAFYQKVIAPILDTAIDLVVANFDSWSHRPFDPHLTVPGTVGMCWFLAVDANLRGRVLDCEGTADQIVDLLFEGLRGHRTTAEATPEDK